MRSGRKVRREPDVGKIIDRTIVRLWETIEELEELTPAELHFYRVSVFGSARIQSGDREYLEVRALASRLTELGCDIVTGGGPGLMEASSKGAFAGDGMAVGLNIDLAGEQPASRYQHISLRFKHFFTRKAVFAKVASAFVVMPGGYGTLDELFEALTLVQTGKTRQMPVILVHEPYWRGLVTWMKERLAAEGMIGPNDLDLLQVYDEPQQVVDAIFAFYEKRGFAPSPAEREVLLNL